MFNRMKNDKGFIAALDQSGGSSPKALALYGVTKDMYHNDDEMFEQMHEMRTRIMTSPSFTSEHILAAILFQNTMHRKVEGKLTADYLWQVKHVVPILKVDLGLAPEENGCQLMKPIPTLDQVCDDAVKHHIFGTKMRSVIKEVNQKGIEAVVNQQFEFGLKIASHGLVPILEPEVDIHTVNKEKAEEILLAEFNKHLQKLPQDTKLMFKVTIPTKAGLYTDLMKDPRVVRVVALSGGYPRDEACSLLAKNPGLIASFSRALTQGLTKQQSDDQFNQLLKSSIDEIYKASV